MPFQEGILTFNSKDNYLYYKQEITHTSVLATIIAIEPKELPKELVQDRIEANKHLLLLDGYIEIVEDPHINLSPLNCPRELHCVRYVNEKGLNINSDARDVIPNSSDYCISCGILLRSELGHIGFTEDVVDGYIIFSERNYISCGTISRRALPLDSPDILGYVE